MMSSDIPLADAIHAAGQALHVDACTEGDPHDGCDTGDWDREAEIAVRAALPSIEHQMRALIAIQIGERAWQVAGSHHVHGHTCTCGFVSPVGRQRTEHILAQLGAEQSIEQRDGVAVLEGLWPCPTVRAIEAVLRGES